MVKFVPNEKGIRALEQQIASKLQPVEVKLDGPEDEAVEHVVQQLRSMGVTPNQDEIRKMVQEQRQGR